jgi:integrase
MSKRAHGEGSICRRRNGTYEGKLTLKAPDGSVVRKSFYGKTRGAVADTMRDYRSEHGTRVEPPAILTLADYLRAWLGALNVRPNTYRLRDHLIRKHIVPHIGGRQLCDLTSDDVRFLLGRWKDDEVGQVTQRTAFVTLSSALNVALREDKIGRNPCSTVPVPRPPRPEILVLDGKQAMKLLGAARDARERALLSLAITTGMRQGEIFALCWGDVDLAAGTVHVKKNLTEDREGRLVRSEPKTAKSRRIIYLPELARKALVALKGSSDYQSRFVFTSPEGFALRKRNFIRRIFKPLLEEAELPDVTFHSLRHTANSLLIEAGEDPLAIAGSLGHADTRMMFERYGHLFNHTARRVAQTADRIFAALEPNCRTIVVNAASRFGKPRKQKRPNPLQNGRSNVVEMRGLEPLTSYMRSKRSTS